MKSKFIIAPLVLGLLIFEASNLFSWGFWAHKEVTRYAIQSLPRELRRFFTEHSDSIVAHAIEPDLRRSSDLKEGFYHYIDIDRYGKYPFAKLPRSYEDAVKKFGRETVDTNGTVPWRIADFTRKLSDAMKRKEKDEIIFFASNLSHYVADACVPLHSTVNYDGQFTNQRGVHARWEAGLPERFGKTYVFRPQQLEYIKDPVATAFDIVLESSTLVDSALAMDLKAREGIPESELMTVVNNHGRTEYHFSDKYYERYHSLLNGMVERRMRESIRRIASYWYTAWVDAGKPDLSTP